MQIKQLTSMTKLLPNQVLDMGEVNSFSILNNERFSYQLALKANKETRVEVTVESELSDLITVRKVGYVPVEVPAFPEPHRHDDGYLSLESGMFPDVLYPIDGEVVVPKDEVTTLWIMVKPNETIAEGVYPITIKLAFDDEVVEKVFQLEVINHALPEQDLMYTCWFHSDCIASVHHVEVFSEAHWDLIEKYMKVASGHGQNMILTPIITPALDTAVGSERPTVQLVDVKKEGQQYTFEFSKLYRWIELAKKSGMRYFEMAHLYSQWGARFCPKVVATVDGEEKRIFGWDTEADSAEYKEFLSQFLPALTQFLETMGVSKDTFFHISDEPNSEEDLQQYSKLKDFVAPYLEGYVIMDALSSFDFYEKGVLTYPVPATSHIRPFLDSDIKTHWTYYCCGQGDHQLSNRFHAMPGARTRVLGTQLYKFDIKGFLQWGFNFYYSQLSRSVINPYEDTCAGGSKSELGGFPAGDVFIVYPYEDGVIESVRYEHFHDALQDMRAFQALEALTSREEVVALVDELAGQFITFNDYPKGEDFLLSLRTTINEKIKLLNK